MSTYQSNQFAFCLLARTGDTIKLLTESTNMLLFSKICLRTELSSTLHLPYIVVPVICSPIPALGVAMQCILKPPEELLIISCCVWVSNFGTHARDFCSDLRSWLRSDASLILYDNLGLVCFGSCVLALNRKAAQLSLYSITMEINLDTTDLVLLFV